MKHGMGHLQDYVNMLVKSSWFSRFFSEMRQQNTVYQLDELFLSWCFLGFFCQCQTCANGLNINELAYALFALEISRGLLYSSISPEEHCSSQIHWYYRYFPWLDSPNNQKEPTVMQTSSRIHEIHKCKQPEYSVSRFHFSSGVDNSKSDAQIWWKMHLSAFPFHEKRVNCFIPFSESSPGLFFLDCWVTIFSSVEEKDLGQ